MAKKLTAKNKRNLFNVLLVIAAVLLLSVMLPAVFPNPTGMLADVVNFFQSVQDHFVSFWMIYTFIALIVLASLKK